MRRSLFALLVMMASIPASAQKDQSVLGIGASSIRIHFSQEVTPAFRGLVERWARDAADAVLTVYRRFPVSRVTIEVHVTDGARVEGGVTYKGSLIRVNVGSKVTSDILRNDWVLTHEMFHLGFPQTDDNRNWMGEGLSTYLEPLARGRAGHLSDAEIWRGMIEGMPEGLPKRGDRGLDRTPTWGRTYWGGALFWLLADIEIRERSGGRKSLDDALRAILNDGGDGSAWWPAKKIFALGDKAIGMPVLETLHKKMGGHPAPTDLGALWKSLGVSLRGHRITFADDAPLAAMRRALTRPSTRVRSRANGGRDAGHPSSAPGSGTHDGRAAGASFPINMGISNRLPPLVHEDSDIRRWKRS